MNIALLGYGKEGQAAKKYFETKFKNANFDIFENLTPAEFATKDYSSYDIIFRSPSIPPLGLGNETTMTRYFFDYCPCPTIGVTATKGKGTTCSFIKALLDAAGEDVYLVGNIGTPAIEILDNLKPTSVVVYEMSSFQLWDLENSPHVAVVGQIEPDHLNVHKDYSDYLAAKAHITTFQTPNDFLVYYQNNPESVKIAETSTAQKIAYPFPVPTEVKDAVKLPGKHNFENALAAIAAVACYKNISPDEYLTTSKTEIIAGLESFKGLPHRLEFVRELNNVKYYDDNFSTGTSSTRVAVNAFPNDNLTIIIGGRDKTANADLPEIYEILRAPQIKHVVLIGESGHDLFKQYPDDPRFVLAESLEEAIQTAKTLAENDIKNSANSENGTKTPVNLKPSTDLTNSEAPTRAIVLMSPAAASFDMFKNVYDRGAQYQNLINSLA